MEKREGQHHKINPEELLYDLLNDYRTDQLDFLKPQIVFYKGEVVDNVDPLKKGRLKLKIFFFDRYVTNEEDLDWYNPSIMGSMFYLPRQGDIVYVTYEDIKNRIGGMWWSYFIRQDQWDWRVDENLLLLKVKGMGADYVMDTSNTTTDFDRELLLINAADHMVKVHSDYILFSKKGWDSSNAIPEADFLSFDGTKSKVTINVNQTFMGNIEMDLRTYFDGHTEKLDKVLNQIKKDFNKHSHTYTHVNPTPTSKPPSDMFNPITMDEDALSDDLKEYSEDSVEKFLTDNPEGRE
jgi:hypothetical protein